jgi:hypothetical protein
MQGLRDVYRYAYNLRIRLQKRTRKTNFFRLPSSGEVLPYGTPRIFWESTVRSQTRFSVFTIFNFLRQFHIYANFLKSEQTKAIPIMVKSMVSLSAKIHVRANFLPSVKVNYRR